MRMLRVGLGFAAISVMALVAPSCLDTLETVAELPDAGPDAGFFFEGGELCSPPNPEFITATMQPERVFLTPCNSDPCPARDVKLVVDPDYCEVDPETGEILPDAKATVTFESSDESIVKKPEDATIGFHEPSVALKIQAAGKTGSATITARVQPLEGDPIIARLAVEVLAPTVPACGGTAQTSLLEGGDRLAGKDKLAGASIAMPKGADKPNKGGYQWHTDPFPATISCADDVRPTGTLALGPAIKFGPESLSLLRELPMSIPLNPALMPDKARMRHLKVAYSGPGFKKPRTIPVADPRIEKVDGVWALTFKAPKLGTYQAVVDGDAGTKSFQRRLTHRALIGISMGGGGTATFGMRHHDLFDVLAPLGGPVHWTWLLHYIENNHLAGFRPIASGTTLADIQLTATPCQTKSACRPDEQCIGVIDAATPGKCVLMPTPTERYLHPQTFNNWWYEYPSAGNGGRFSRKDYTQIFRDLAIMYGNPNGENLAPGAENLPAGVPVNHKSVIGDHPNDECRMWVDPIDEHPDHDKQEAIANACPGERCAHTLTLTGYYDDEYNPDGTFPVITVCDGSDQNELLTPWANRWEPVPGLYPLEVGLAVDYNGNGVRDELEPIIRAGHEKWYDHGTDGRASADEPGYEKGKNDDPEGDDYDPQYNPTGTEGDHRYQAGEKYDDFGLDGVPGTKQQPKTGYANPGDGYDVGEGDGRFTVARGLQRFWDRDSHSILHRIVDSSQVPGGEMTDQALRRIDLWTDGGTRDLFNFAVDAQHLVGALTARGRAAAYYTDFTEPPGLDPNDPLAYRPSRMIWDDMPGVVFQRYGDPDMSDADVERGSGKHVGTGDEVAGRLQSALYYIGSRWQQPDLRVLAASSGDSPAEGAPECEVLGNCSIEFESSNGRVGPVGVTLPPGYAHSKLQGIRYPVIYFLHGYGQAPTDLLAAQALFTNWMNSPADSMASRLPKAIIVYVDGQCRPWKRDGKTKSECLRGTFYADSPREDSAQDETWFLELMDYVDRNYRTLGESVVDWTE